MIYEDPILNQLTLHTVGFLREQNVGTPNHDFSLCGSGTLVSIAGIKGILTAGHVITNLLQSGNGKLVTIINQRSGNARRLDFVPKECGWACLYDGTESGDGPDIGFLKIPQLEDALSNHNAYYNFDVRVQKATEQSPPLTNCALAGFIEENTVLKERTTVSVTKTFTMTLAYVDLVSAEKPNKYYISEFKLRHNDAVPAPRSYGGLSGSAIWLLADEPGVNNRLITGLAFYEKGRDSNNHVIRCHADDIIYSDLATKVQERFASS